MINFGTMTTSANTEFFTTQTESQLVRKAKNGDQQAFEEIFNRCQPAVFRYFHFRLQDSAEADDLTGEVFVRMVEKIKSYDDQGRPILAWLYTIARNLLTDHYRKKGLHVQVELDESLPETEMPNPVEISEQNTQRSQLQLALRQLTEIQRQVLILRFLEDRSIAEVGAIMGSNEGAVKALQHRALASLKRLLEG